MPTGTTGTVQVRAKSLYSAIFAYSTEVICGFGRPDLPRPEMDTALWWSFRTEGSTAHVASGDDLGESTAMSIAGLRQLPATKYSAVILPKNS